MKNSRDRIGKGLAHALRLSPDAAFEREKTAEAQRAAYRREYWQKYSKRVRRVYGTLTPEEYAAIAARAAACQEGRPSIWRQLRDEAFTHAKGEALPPAEVLAEQRRLIVELRRIGNNMNQLAKITRHQ